MSYGSSPAPGKKAGGGLIFLIIIGIGAYLLLSSRGPAGNQNNAGPGLDRSADYDLPDTDRQPARSSGLEEFGGGGDFDPAAQSARSSDWAIEDATPEKSSPAVKNGNASGTANGDWSIKDASGKKSDDNQFQFSQPATGSNKSSNTVGGDWSIDDASGSKAKAKKEGAKNGDWSIGDGGK